MRFTATLFSSLITISFVTGLQVVGPTTTLTLTNKFLAPDGVNRSASVVNGGVQGPLITGYPSTQFNINVKNSLNDSSMYLGASIHWHGLHMKNHAWADGPAFVNQCPIAPKKQFMYQFPANGQSGTYWYHSHYSTQYCDGVRGPFVIYDPQDPHRSLYDIDDANTVMTLADWYDRSSIEVAGSIPPVYQATLINGMGRNFANPGTTPLAVVKVTKGVRYRFRIVNMACDPGYTFSIDGHTLTVIEADGESTKPLLVDSLQIYAGQRYSVILNANQAVGNYWIRAVSNTATPKFDPNSAASFQGGINSAILRYAGARVIDPATPLKPFLNMLDQDVLQPLTSPAAPGPADPNHPDVYKVNLNMTFDGSIGGFRVNGVPFVAPTVPVLNQILSGTQDPHDIMPNGGLIALPRNRVIQLSIPAANIITGSPHPIHLHGHSFSVIRGAGMTGYNFKNPVRRDVVSLGDSPNDNVTIRFVTDNAGPWFLHCHIDWHLNAGMAVVFGEDIPGIKSSTHPTPAWENLCNDWHKSNITEAQ